MRKYCKCGCGKIVKGNNTYIHGHNRRGLASNTANGKWSRYYDKCIKCGTTKYKHNAKGLCIRCYKKELYKKRKAKLIKWSRKYEKCIDCGTTDRPYAANGRCIRCHVKAINRRRGRRERKSGNWSLSFAKCIKCGTTKYPHAGHGLCSKCYLESRRDTTKAEFVCPVCGTKLNKLYQHMALKIKTCKEHFDYMYNLLKIYFYSDFSLDEISKELNMDRHSLSRWFVRLFGEDQTRLRNEKVRRCIISEQAALNYNRQNQYGTVVEYNSPYQGKLLLRSKTEAKYADFLTKNKYKWFYEVCRFPYIDENENRRSYTPDFYLEDCDVYIEVKSRNITSDKLAEVMDKINRVCSFSKANIWVVCI